MKNRTLWTDVYFPTNSAGGGLDPEAAPCPVIVLGHGFSQSKSHHVNQGKHWASRGCIALIPNFNAASDHSRNADELRRCIDWIFAQHADPSSQFFGKVWTNRVGATGHSAGGLSAIVAAARDPRIRALAPMDPVDNKNLGVNALPKVKIPTAIIYSEPSACNARGSALQLYNAATPPKRGIKIVGANHTDPQDPAGLLSSIICGKPNATRQARYRRYVTGWFEYHLRDDTRYGPWVFNLPDSHVAADLASGLITYDEAPAPPDSAPRPCEPEVGVECSASSLSSYRR
jgi:dienelactone hydrolase